MSAVRRSLCWFLVVVLATIVAVMASGQPGEQAEPTSITTAVAPGSTPVIAHIEETP